MARDDGGNPVNILSIDGGQQNRGLVDLFMLQDIFNLTTVIVRQPNKLSFLYESRKESILGSRIDRYELRKLLDRVTDPIHPTDVFDMIVGTTTGSLISFGLVGGGNPDSSGRRQCMTLTELREMYHAATPYIYEKRVGAIPFYNYFAKNFLRIPIVPTSEDGFKNISRTKFDETKIRHLKKDEDRYNVAKQLNISDRYVLFDTRRTSKYNVTLILKVSSDSPIQFDTPVNINTSNYISDDNVGEDCPLHQQRKPHVKALKDENSYIESVLNITSFSAMEKKIPIGLTNGTPIYFDMKQKNEATIVQRVSPIPSELYRSGSTDVKEHVRALRKQSIDDVSYFARLLEVAMVIAARCDVSPSFVKPLHHLVEAICDACVQAYRFGEQLNVRKAVLTMKRNMFQSQEDHPEVATSYYQLSLAYKTLGYHTKAIDLLQKCLQIRTKRLNYIENETETETNCLDIARCYDVIAGCYSDLAQYSNSISYHEKSLEIRLRIFGHGISHLDIASSYANIAFCCQGMEDYEKSLRYHDRCLVIRTGIYGRDSNHPDIAISFRDIANCYAYSGQYDKALRYFKHCLKMKTGNGEASLTLGDVIGAYNGIAICHQEMSNCKKAIAFHERSLDMIMGAIAENRYDKPDMAIVFRDIGTMYESKGYRGKAEEFYKHSLNVHRVVFADLPPDTPIVCQAARKLEML